MTVEWHFLLRGKELLSCRHERRIMVELCALVVVSFSTSHDFSPVLTGYERFSMFYICHIVCQVLLILWLHVVSGYAQILVIYCWVISGYLWIFVYVKAIAVGKWIAPSIIIRELMLSTAGSSLTLVNTVKIGFARRQPNIYNVFTRSVIGYELFTWREWSAL